MRKTAILVAAAVASLATSPVRAEFDTKGWTWRCPVETTAPAGFVAAQITPEIFDGSQPDLNDLRIVDSAGNLVPHLVSWGKTGSHETREWHPAKLLNPTYQPNEYSRITLDFGGPAEKNLVRLRLSGDNFRRRAQIEGSPDGEKWEMVAENLWLFDVSLPGKSFRADTLEFPANTQRYLRVTVFSMSDDPRRVTFESAETCMVQQQAGNAPIPVALKIVSTRLEEDTRASIWEFDTGFRNLPLESMAFAFGDAFFSRAFELSGRNSLKETVTRRSESGSEQKEVDTAWSHVASGVLYRIKEKDKIGESLAIRGNMAPYRYLQLRVYNADNPPLRLTASRAAMRPARVIFRSAPPAALSLFGGNANCGAPSYDIATAFKGLEEQVLPAASFGPFAALAHEQPRAPWSERHSTLIWIALLAAAAAMLFMILKNLKGMPKSD